MLIDEALRALAVLAARHSDHQQAACLLGAAEAHAPATMSADERRIDERLAAEYQPSRRRLGGPTWDKLAEEGRRLDLNDAIELGLATASRLATAGAAVEMDRPANGKVQAARPAHEETWPTAL